MKYTETADEFSHIVGYEYDLINNLTALVENINGTSYTTSYTYDDDNRVTGVTNGNVNETYTYDGFGRVSGKTTKDGTTNVLTETLEYVADTTNATTSGQVKELTIDAASDITFEYTYDDNGNITQVVSGGKTTNYTYDKANQLLREDNQAANYTHIWTYDDAGNILKREEYAYTTGVPSGDATTINYAYSNANWGDLLTSYNSQTITHDTIGNPLSDGRRTYTWKHGRELATLTQDGTTWDFTYNADGLRTKRTNGSTTYNYVYNGSSLSQMSVGTHLLNFAYDASGAPMAVTYDGVTYYYATNLQGDIIAILDGSGTAVVQYMYDAWGRLLSEEPAVDSLGNLNPLRYRGYTYDPETSLYYLQSRCYDPALGRFINADAFAATGQGLLGNNMFAYCNNNPTLLEDVQGESATIAGGICGGLFGFLGAVVSELTDENDGVRWSKVLQCTVSGAAAGAFAGFVADASIATFGAVPAILISAAGGTAASAINSGFVQYTLTGDVDYKKVASDAILGGITNGLCTGTSSQLDPLVDGIKEGLNYASRQVSAEVAYGLNTYGEFAVNDLLPTIITGFGAWYGGMGYDYLVK